MNKRNYNNEMKNIILEEQKHLADDESRSLLLHACCAPCSSTCMERVRDGLKTTVYFYNPNITSAEEYDKRAKELKRLIDIFNEDTKRGHIDYLEGEYDPKEFTAVAKGYEECPERGERCVRCFRLRLEAAGKAAKENDFDYFTTTLTLSPLKDAELLNSIGFAVADKLGGIKWLPSDFKKDDGYKKSLELSKEYDLYRQDYCGCIYSKLPNSKLQREHEKQ